MCIDIKIFMSDDRIVSMVKESGERVSVYKYTLHPVAWTVPSLRTGDLCKVGSSSGAALNLFNGLLFLCARE